jgi:glycosyltransferase involved in cell wall biosynthesis
MKLLARFDRVWAVSAASREELLGYWTWLGIARPPPVAVLPMGADFNGAPRASGRPAAGPPRLLSVGIIEPRKNQDLLLEACAELWDEGLAFELHLVGRVNPHFGPPIEARIRAAAAVRPGLRWHPGASDELLAGLYGSARAVLVPTLAEGCGLPVLESLWMGVPCVCTDLPALLENAAGGGCLTVGANDRAAWKSAIRSILTDEPLHGRLAAEAGARPLPTWADSARTLLSGLAS